MLSDFLTLEVYFGAPNAALYLEDLVERHGREKIRKALKAGDLMCRRQCNGDGQGRTLTWLTEQGREKASPVLTSPAT